MTFEEFSREREEIRAIGNSAVKNAQDLNLKLGIPNVYSKNGHLYYQMPNGKITDKNPFKRHQLLMDNGFIFDFDNDAYVHKSHHIVMSREWVDDNPLNTIQAAITSYKTIRFFDIENSNNQQKILKKYFNS
jgi:hypothetical protein